MTQPLVVLTYPDHFLLTALTIQSYLKHHTPSSITVIADDLSDQAGPNYIKDCEQQYGCQVIPVSTVAPALPFANNPWIRQQIVKLYLDQILSNDVWFFTDGDVEYCFPVAHNTVPYSIVRGGQEQANQNAYVAMMLGIDTPGMYVQHSDIDWQPDNTDQVCVSNPPFRTMQAHTLQSLRTHIEQRHQKSMIEIHQKLNYLMSEWELIANFQVHVVKQSVDLVYYPTVPMQSTPVTVANQPDYCKTCYHGDSEFDAQWWHQKEIKDIRNRTNAR
jgi:hypothetical protein